MCLRGPRLLVLCNVHGSWQHICRSKHLVVAHLQKFTFRGNTRLEVRTCVEGTQLTRNNLLTQSITLHYTNILLVYQHRLCHASSLQYRAHKT